MRKEKHEARQKLATELPQSLPTTTANALQGHNMAAAPWNPSSKLPSISNPAGTIPSGPLLVDALNSSVPRV